VDTTIHREGREDDLCRLLLQRNLVPREALEKLVLERRTQAKGGAAPPPLGAELVRLKLVASTAVLQSLRSETRAFAKCAKCGAFHAIYYYWPSTSQVCEKCGAALRPRPAGETSEGQESLVGPPPAGGEMMLDLGQPGAKPAPPAPQESIMRGLQAGGETMLDLGQLGAKPAPPAPQESIMRGLSAGGETMLDLGQLGARPAPQESLTGAPPPGGGETLLDLGTMQGRTPAPPAKPPSPQDSMPGRVLPGSGETVLDLGTLKAPPPPVQPPPLKSEPTILLGSPSGASAEATVLADTPRSKSRSSSRTTDPKSMEITPRTSTGQAARAYAPMKNAPKEVLEAAKDEKRVFGKYILVKELGRGGAGVVYLAWDTTLAQNVALKFIRDQDMGETGTSTGSQAVEDFQREARMSAKLRHPNIIRIYELGSMSNRYYLSMDYIEGGSLLEVIHGGRERNTDTTFNTDPRKFLGIMIKIASAVDHAHKHQPPVIHRDLKPHNVLVDMGHNPYVVDFGLAKEVELSTSQHTMTGVVKGTPSYMAPEQAEGRNKDVDARTDVYSLGAIFYEVLTGRPPFTGGSVREVLNSICTVLPDRPNEAIAKSLMEKPDGNHRPRPVPKPLETICMKALEKAKTDRYQSAQDLADDINRFLNDEDILAQEPGLYRRIRRKIRQHPLISGGVAATILCAGVIAGSLYYTASRRTDESGLNQLVAIAEEHLKKSDWAALRTDAENLRKLAPKHRLIAELEKAAAGHEADLRQRREAWTAALKRLAVEPVAAVLEGVRAPFRDAGDLRQDFSEQLDRSLIDLQAAVETEARDLVGTGAREEWLNPAVKSTARACRDRIVQLQGLATDPDFPFRSAAALPGLRDGLDKLLSYEGIWDLRVNVAPFARVTLRRGGNVVAEEWTPVGLKGIEVAGEYRLELSWPSPEKAGQKVSLDLKGLKHGALVVATGDMTKADVRVEK
jgi:serine/threonine protein kinase